MSQDVFSTITPSTTSGTQLAALLVSFKDAMMSGLIGPTRPPELQAGGAWIDNSQEGTPNFIWSYKVYTGTLDVVIFRINLTSSAISFTGSDSDFQIKRTSDDAIGAVLKLIKNRIAGTMGQSLANDVVGELQFTGRTQLGVDTVIGRVRTVANQTTTSTGAGSRMVFEITKTGETALSEAMRILDGNVGIGGVSAPLAALHIKSTTGMKSERVADDAVGTRLNLKKMRITGTGATQSADVLANIDISTTDNASAESVSAQVIATATQAHTAAAQGTKLDIKVAKTGEAVLTTQMTVADYVESVARHDFNSLKLVSQSIATAASIAQVDASKAIVIFTGATAMEVYGIDSTISKTKVIVLHNNSSASVTLKHFSSSASVGADRMKLPNGDDIEILPDSSAELFYSTVESLWKVKSGSGTGGSAGKSFASQTVTAGGTVNSTVNDSKQLRYISGATGGVLLSTTPFGVGGGWKDGTEIDLIGGSDANSVTLTNSDVANGAVGNFETIEIGRYTMITLVWSALYSRWILKARG